VRKLKRALDAARKAAPRVSKPLGIYPYFDGEPVPDDARLTICKGPRLSQKEIDRDTEALIILGQVECSDLRKIGAVNRWTRDAVIARWQAAGEALPGERGYNPSAWDRYGERTWPGYMIEKGLIVREDAAAWGALIPPDDQDDQAETVPVPDGINPTVKRAVGARTNTRSVQNAGALGGSNHSMLMEKAECP
jgi:hypothetical protein